MSAITAFLPVKQGDPIQILRERFKRAQDRQQQALHDRGFATVVMREPTDAQLRRARSPQQVEALAVRCTRPSSFAPARLVTPRRYPRVAAR